MKLAAAFTLVLDRFIQDFVRVSAFVGFGPLYMSLKRWATGVPPVGLTALHDPSKAGNFLQILARVALVTKPLSLHFISKE